MAGEAVKEEEKEWDGTGTRHNAAVFTEILLCAIHGIL